MATSGDDDAPLVTAIIPTFNRPNLAVTAVQSVLDQTYENIELVVVDDGSDVPIESEIADLEMDSLVDVQVHRHEKNRGANTARNIGISAANGEYIAFLDDDDYWCPEKIERQVTALQEAEEDTAIAFTGQRCVDSSGITTTVTRPTNSSSFLKGLIAGASFGTFSTVMVRNSVFDRVGMLDERFPCWQDREWYYRLAEHFEFVAIRELLIVRRFTDSPQISDDFPTKRDIAYPLMVQKHRSRAVSLGWKYERQFLAVLSRAVAASAISNGHYFQAVRHLVRSIWYHPVLPQTYVYLAVALGGRVTHRTAQHCKQLLNYQSSDHK